MKKQFEALSTDCTEIHTYADTDTTIGYRSDTDAYSWIGVTVTTGLIVSVMGLIHGINLFYSVPHNMLQHAVHALATVTIFCDNQYISRQSYNYSS